MIIWEGTDVICCFNVVGQTKLKRIRLVHLPKEPDIDKVLAFQKLFLTVLPAGYRDESVQLIKRTRYFD